MPGDVTGFVDALIFEVRDRDYVGYISPGSDERSFCCTEELMEAMKAKGEGTCEKGHVIVNRIHAGDNKVVEARP